MRLAVLGTDGVPLPGPENLYVSKALTTVTLGSNVAEATELEERNGSDEICLNYTGVPSLKNGTFSIELCQPDPYAEAILGGGDVLTVGPDAPAGFAMPALGPINRPGISIELWAHRILDGDIDPDYPYAWWSIPKVKNLVRQDANISNEAHKPTYQGIGLENPNWFDGPLNDWPASSDRWAQWVPSSTVPEPQCGYQALVPS
jgi:hypothetical protein